MQYIVLAIFLLSFLFLFALQRYASRQPLSDPWHPQRGRILGEIVLYVLVGCLLFGAGRVSAEEVEAADVPSFEHQPLTSVVVTQCNLLVAAYITSADGKLHRFDHTNQTMKAPDLLTLAATAKHAERVEVTCDSLAEGIGAKGFETL